MTKKKAVKKQSQEVSTDVLDLEADSGGGFEEADASAYAIPFIAILQTLSPQCKKKDDGYIKGAEEGMLYNSVKEEVTDGETDGFMAIPCHYRRVYIEWIPRNQGGGFVCEHSVEDGIELLRQCTKDEKNKDVLPNGNHLVDTRIHYLLQLNKGEAPSPVVVAMASTQIKKSRKWMSNMGDIKMKRKDGSLFTPPMFSHVYHLTTEPENRGENDWYGWHTELIERVNSAELYQIAKALRDAVKSGKAKATYHEEETVVEEEAF